MPTTWRSAWPWLRIAAGLAVIAALVRIVGGEAFLAGVRALDPHAALAALAITALTTACCAWRWQLVLRGLGGNLRAGAALGAYYRSEFLDATLPGGVLGDVYRGVRRGVRASNLGRGLRSVFWERVLGQAMQVLLAAAVLLVLPSPARSAMPLILAGCVVAALIALVLLRVLVLHVATRWRDATLTAMRELRGLSPGSWCGIAVASVAAIAGYAIIFAIAAHAVGIVLPWPRLLPLVMLALVAAAIPFNIAGFGPREGVAAWAFGAAGTGAHSGVAAATLYGILGLVAVAPGGLLLLLDWLRGSPHRPSQ